MRNSAVSESTSKRERFFTNVLWSWFHVAVQILSALLLSRYVIRKLGPEGYGLWQLSFSLIGYYAMVDLGFRSAVVFYSARYRAREEYEALNELVSTLVAYFTVMALALMGLTFFLSPHASQFSHVSPRFRSDFARLVFMIGLSISSSVVFNVFSGFVEGFQRFDLANQIRVVTFLIRYCGCAVMLYLGYGLVEMGWMALCSQILNNTLYVVVSKRIFPPLRFSFELVRFSAWKKTAAYGIHTFVAGAANMSLEQSPSLVIARMRGGAAVGFYSLPFRILQYAADAVSRVGIVVSAQAAELTAKSKLDTVARLAIYANRYCLSLYMPLTIMVLIYGRELIQLWVGAEFVKNSAPLLPIILISTTFTMAGQFSSSTILFGMGKHRSYAYALLGEALLNIAGMILVIPRYGLMGAALVAVSLMTLVRGILTPWLACRQLSFDYLLYMRSIYARPVMTALPVFALIAWCKMTVWPGRAWGDLIAAACSTAGLYLGAAYFTCLERDHKVSLVGWAMKRWNRLMVSAR